MAETYFIREILEDIKKDKKSGHPFWGWPVCV
jgi:hypothetical protein